MVFAATSKIEEENQVMPGVYVFGLDTAYPIGEIRRAIKDVIAEELGVPKENVSVYFPLI